jgi:predicted CoA-binding protein
MEQKDNWNEAITDFMKQRRIAVAGVSRSRTEAANTIYRKLRDSGYQVFPVNPRAAALEDAACYPELAAIPGGVDAVVVATHPEASLGVVRQCADLGIKHVWLHRSFGSGSVSDAAVSLCRERGIEVIPGGCPMMFCAPVDVGHKCMRWFLRLTGGMPKAA